MAKGNRTNHPGWDNPKVYPNRQEICVEICAWLSEGKSLSSYLKQEGKPCAQLIYEWLREDSQFRALYNMAKHDRADSLFDELNDLADEPPQTFTDDKGIVRVDSGAVQDKRVRIDTKKWAAAHLKPKEYGEHIEIGGNVDINSGMDRETLLIETARSLLYVMNEAALAMDKKPVAALPEVIEGEADKGRDDA